MMAWPIISAQQIKRARSGSHRCRRVAWLQMQERVQRSTDLRLQHTAAHGVSELANAGFISPWHQWTGVVQLSAVALRFWMVCGRMRGGVRLQTDSAAAPAASSAQTCPNLPRVGAAASGTY